MDEDFLHNYVGREKQRCMLILIMKQPLNFRNVDDEYNPSTT